MTIRTERRGVGVLLEKIGGVERVEFGEDFQAEVVIVLDALGVEAAGADPNGVDAEIDRRFAAFEKLIGETAVDAADFDPGASAH